MLNNTVYEQILTEYTGTHKQLWNDKELSTTKVPSFLNIKFQKVIDVNKIQLIPETGPD